MRLLAFACDRVGCGAFSSAGPGGGLPVGWHTRDDGADWCANCASARRLVEPQRVLAVVAAEYGLSVERLVGAGRDARGAAMRQVAALLLRRCTAASLPEIATLLGRESHTTALHAIRRAQDQCAASQEYATWVGRLETQISQ